MDARKLADIMWRLGTASAVGFIPFMACMLYREEWGRAGFVMGCILACAGLSQHLYNESKKK